MSSIRRDKKTSVFTNEKNPPFYVADGIIWSPTFDLMMADMWEISKCRLVEQIRYFMFQILLKTL